MIAASDGTPAPPIPVAYTVAEIVSAHDVHRDENWTYAGGCSVNLVIPNNVPNGVLNNGTAIIFSDTNISQVICWFKN